MDIYIDAIGVGPGRIEGLNPANFTKSMLCNSGIESVFRNARLTADQSKIISRQNQMQESGLFTNGAIAVIRLQNFRGLYLKLNGLAVATS